MYKPFDGLQIFFCSKSPDNQKICGEEEQEGDQEVSWTTRGCSVKAVLFKNLCKPIARKLLSLIKIEATKGLLCNTVVFSILAKSLKISVEVHIFLVKLQTVGYNLFENEFLHCYALTIWLKL